MKTISKDQTFVDYTAAKYGVRVWRDACQPIGLENEAWTEYDPKHQLPVDRRVIEFPMNRTEWITALAQNVCDYEQYRANELNEDRTELRQLLAGSRTFDSVISPQ
jgi:hypothetical protein